MENNGTSEELQLVAFKIDQEEFAVNILLVKEIEKIIHITRVPKAPDAIKGVINLRGEVIPVIDLRRRLGLVNKEIEEQNKIVIIRVNDIAAGIIVDSVSEVVRLSNSQIEVSPNLISSVEQEYIDGIGKLNDRLLILLNIDKIIDL